ncbi:hypothetical protein PFAG_00564 [Plasmodium falciparum Santa Lucia]|uniref:Uncharacterized protein n=1 Tax=Plasmodium falciparum Santa Lucia TaxID=478859 RepID=W7G150_PLAFA|nr:hypothetical protein PFAG_00564 [Plasmodium falciparum Santa Lucia]
METTFEHVITKFWLHFLSSNSLLSPTTNISLSKWYFFYRGKLNWKFGILGHFLQHHKNFTRTSLLFHHIVHDLLYIQNGSTYFPLRLYFVCTSIFLHSPFSPSTFAAQLTCTSKHLGGVYQFLSIFHKIFVGAHIVLIFVHIVSTCGFVCDI